MRACPFRRFSRRAGTRDTTNAFDVVFNVAHYPKPYSETTRRDSI